MASLISWLAYAGARKSDGTPVSSGTAYFYQPGTAGTPVTVYSDKDGLAAVSQPVALDAAGKATVYTKTPVRAAVFDSAGASVAVQDRANTVHASQVEIEQSGFTGTDLVTGRQVSGGRTDLQTVLALVNTGLGGNSFLYQESASATARTFNAALAELFVTPQDFGAAGDDNTDDTAALNSWITRGQDSGKALFIPPGTYRTTTGLSLGTGALGLRIIGASRTDSIIKNMSTTGAAITVNVGSAVESHIVLENFAITASTTSSGAAVTFTNGNGATLNRLSVGLHRTGYDVSAVSFTHLEDCLVVSTDGNAAGKGFRSGASTTFYRCRATHTNGKGFSLEGAFTRAHMCQATITTGTGYDVAAADCTVTSSAANGCTTGFNIGAFARVGTMLCASTDGSTADYVEASGTTVSNMVGNNFTTVTLSNQGGNAWLSQRPQVFKKNKTTYNGTTNTSWTPDLSLGEIQIWQATNNAHVGFSLTINATSTTGLVDGQSFYMVLDNATNVGGSAITYSYNAQYTGGPLNPQSLGNGGVGSLTWFHFVWKSATSKWCVLDTSYNVGVGAATGIW